MLDNGTKTIYFRYKNTLNKIDGIPQDVNFLWKCSRDGSPFVNEYKNRFVLMISNGTNCKLGFMNLGNEFTPDPNASNAVVVGPIALNFIPNDDTVGAT